MGANDKRGRALPISGVVVAGVGAVVAAVASWAAWPDMAATYEEVSGPNLRPSVANRASAAIGTPLVLSAMALVLIPIVHADRRFFRKHPAISAPQTPTTKRNQARVLSATWIGLTLVLVIVHLTILAQFTGREVDVVQLLGIGVGLFTVCFGSALPLARPTDPSQYPPDFRRLAVGLEAAYRPAGFALVAVGVVTIVLSLLWPLVGVVVGWVGFVAVMIVTTVMVARAMK
ncbi:hypothetical protein [Prescottella equi]